MPNYLSLNADQLKVVIIGGGVIGLSVAWRLTARDRSIDKGAAGAGASHAAAGMLAVIELIIKQKLRSVQRLSFDTTAATG